MRHRVADAGNHAPSSIWRAINGCRTPSGRDQIHVPDRDAGLFVRLRASRKRDRRRPGKRQRSTGLFNRSRSMLLYSAFAEAFLAFRRIDSVARLRRLLHLLQSCAITGGANIFGQNFTLFLHNDQSFKIRQKVESI
jgi:hypothetical protein